MPALPSALPCDIPTSDVDVRQVRAVLAAERVAHSDYARACGLSRTYVARILSGSLAPGELARIKLAHGLTALGLSLDRQAVHA